MAPRLTTRTIELRRVVITGMGTLNPLGNDVATSWNAAQKGVSGIRAIERFPVDDLPVKFAGQIEGFDAATVFEKIPEYQEIRKRGLKRDDPEYWVLLNKANEKFYKAVKKVAEENKYDVVVEKGAFKFESTPPDVTQKVIDALDK